MAQSKKNRLLEISADMEKQRQAEMVKGLQDKYQAALDEITQKNKAVEAALGIRRGVNAMKPVAIRSDNKRGESVAVLVTSDWHLEETVEPDTVQGKNEYNLAIARKRVRSIWPNFMNLVNMCRSAGTIDTLVLAMLGDHITGYIHEELQENNGLSPTQAVVEVIKLMTEGIEFLLKEGGFKRIIVTTKWGNHGRTTEKPRVGTAYKNSYEWMLFELLRGQYAADPRVEWQMSTGYFNYMQIYGWTYRFHHGDGIRYGGGVGDVDIPLNKAIAQWNKLEHAHVDVLGHWHVRKCANNFVINGSVIGYNAYSIKIKASYEPPKQSFFLVHPTFGKTVEAPIRME